jgi:hypothetical protein
VPRGAAHAGLVAVAREADGRLGPDAWQDEARRALLGGLEQQVARGAHAAADDDLIGIEGVDRVGDADSESLTQSFDRGDGLLVAGLRGLHDVGALADPGGLAELVELAARGKAFERSGLRRLRTRLRWPGLEVPADDLVPELTGRPGRAAEDPPADDDAAADPGAHREHHKALGDWAQILVVGLGERRDGRVVVDEDGHLQVLGELAAQRDMLQRDVHRAARGTRGEVHDRRDADPHGGCGTVVGNESFELRDERI